jgi:hypothetical protein
LFRKKTSTVILFAYGFLFNPVDGDTSFIDKEFEAARRAGLKPERLLNAPLPFPTGACLRFPTKASSTS